MVVVVSVLLANAVWFGAGFVLFALRSVPVAATLVPLEEGRARLVVAGQLRFLGGLNAALMGLCVLLMVRHSAFAGERRLEWLLAVLALAHASQAIVNLHLGLAYQAGRPVPWRAFRGLMLLILIGDAVLASADLAVALTQSA